MTTSSTTAYTTGNEEIVATFVEDGVRYIIKRTIYGKYFLSTPGGHPSRKPLNAWEVIDRLTRLLKKE